jgi:hypothetical protein
MRVKMSTKRCVGSKNRVRAWQHRSRDLACLLFHPQSCFALLCVAMRLRPVGLRSADRGKWYGTTDESTFRARLDVYPKASSAVVSLWPCTISRCQRATDIRCSVQLTRLVVLQVRNREISLCHYTTPTVPHAAADACRT